MDDAWMGEMTDITDDVWTLGQEIDCVVSPLLLGIFARFSADSDGVNNGLPDGSTDESNDVWMEGDIPGTWTFRKFHPAILMDTFTEKSADGWTDRMDNRHTDSQTDCQVES